MLFRAFTPADRPTSHVEPWRVRVSDEDVLQARDAWLRARRAAAPAETVRELREDLERLRRARDLQGRDGQPPAVLRLSPAPVPSPRGGGRPAGAPVDERVIFRPA